MWYESADINVANSVDNGDSEHHNGDLRAWEYLTANFDDAGFLHDQSNSDTSKQEVYQTIGNESNFPQIHSCSQPIPTLNEVIIRQGCNSLLRDEFVQNRALYSESIDYTPVPLRSIPTLSTVSHDKCTLPQMHTRTGTGESSCFQPITSLQTNIDKCELYRDARQFHMTASGDTSINHLSNQPSSMLKLSKNSLSTERQSYNNIVDIPFNSLRSDSHDSAQQTIYYTPPLPDHKLLKPLTAYRFFYRDERENILKGIDGIPEPVNNFSDAKLRQLLDQRWYFDPNKKKRAHRKTLGKLGFENFSTIISQRWQNLPCEGRNFYHRVADHDKAQYERYLNFSKLPVEESKEICVRSGFCRVNSKCKYR